MILGLRLLVWVHHARSEMEKQNDPSWREYLDCGRCKHTRALKRHLNCGHIPKSEWTHGGFPQPPHWPCQIVRGEDEGEIEFRARLKTCVCPGYLIRLPQVMDVARQFDWYQTGQLQMGVEQECGYPTPILKAGIDILKGSSNELESYIMAEANK